MEERGTLSLAISGHARRHEHTDGYESSPVVVFIPLEVGRVLLYDA